MSKPRLTRYERQLRAAIREAMAVLDDGGSCPDCERNIFEQDNDTDSIIHDETCIHTTLRLALKRP